MVQLQANGNKNVVDVVFVVEATPQLGAYLDNLKQSYILPTLNWFNGGPPEEMNYGCDYSCTLYSLVTFQSADCAPNPAVTIKLPTISTHEFIQALDNVKFEWGTPQQGSHVAEGLASALQLFDDISTLRDASVPETQKHCILVLNTPPYQIVSQESPKYSGYKADQLVEMMHERGIHFSLISARKDTKFYHLFEKGGGDLHAMMKTNFATDSRHSVLLSGFKLEERPSSPTVKKEEPILVPGDTKSAVPVSPMSQMGGRKGNSPAPGAIGDGTFKVPSTNIATQPQPPSSQVQITPSISNPSSGLNQQFVRPQHAMPVTSNPNIPVTAEDVKLPFSVGQGIQPGTQQHPGIMAQPGLRQTLRGPVPVAQQNHNLPQQNQGLGHVTMSLSMANPNQAGQPGMIFVSSHNPTTSHNPSIAGLSSAQTSGISGNPMLSQNQGMPVHSVQGQVPNQGLLPPHSMTSQNQGVNQIPGAPSLAQRQPKPNIITNNTVTMPGPVTDPSLEFSLEAGRQQQQQKVIWTGALEWQDRVANTADPNSKVTRTLGCHVYSTGVEEINATAWPSKLSLQYLPSTWLQPLRRFFKQCRTVNFHFNKNDPEATKSLYTRFQKQNWAGCIHFPQGVQCDVRIMVLLHSNQQKSFMGLIPHDQNTVLEGIKKIVIQQKMTKNLQKGAPPGTLPQMAQTAAVAPGAVLQTTAPQPQPQPGNQIPGQQQPPQMVQSQPQQQQQQQQQPIAQQPGNLLKNVATLTLTIIKGK